jgi:hypothetical protein
VTQDDAAENRSNPSSTADRAGCLLDNVRIKPVLRGSHEPAAVTGSEKISVDSLLDPFGSHPGVRVCADRVGDFVRCHRKCIRVQSRRRLGASLHYQRAGLWPPSLFARGSGLVDACHSSVRASCFCRLVDRSDPSPGNLAEASLWRNSSSRSHAACDSMSISL